MKTIDTRDVLPIRDHPGFEKAADAVKAVLDANAVLSADESRFVTEVNEAIALFLRYCKPATTRPEPYRLLAYLLNDVLNSDSDVVLAATGIDISEVLLGNRELTEAEIAPLSSYFRIAPEALRS